MGQGMGFNSEAADELVQNTWMTFLNVAPRFEGRSKIKTFLIGILHNKVREYRRDQRKHDHEEWNEFESRFDSSGHWVRAPKNPELMADTSQVMDQLQKCIDLLPQNQKLVFLLKEVEQLSTQEVSEAVNISENNLRVLTFRSKANLRECLEKHDA